MPRPKSLIRSITEAIDARELAADEPVPPVDEGWHWRAASVRVMVEVVQEEKGRGGR